MIKDSSMSDPAADAATRDVLVVTRLFPPEAGGIQEMAYCRCLRDPGRVAVFTGGWDNASEFDRAQPFPVHRWKKITWNDRNPVAKVFQRLRCLWAEVTGVMRLVRRQRFKYVEWFHGYDAAALLVLTWIVPARFYICVHGHDVLSWSKGWLRRKLLQWTLNRMDVVVCACSFVEEFLRSHFRIRVPTRIINPVPRPEKFGPVPDDLAQLRAAVRKRHGIPDDAIVILTVGRMVRRKGMQLVTQSLPKLVAEGINVFHLLCGRGEMEAEIRSAAARLGVADRVIFAGYVPDGELASYYASCDVFAMLSFQEKDSIEGFGIVCIEAAYFGRPAVATTVGGMKDSVRNGETGLLVDPGSDDEIHEAFRRMCTDKGMRETMGRNALRHARSLKLEWLDHPVPEGTKSARSAE
jgi:phosphatidylinositol alpha-1,6-mannosyltransferase